MPIITLTTDFGMRDPDLGFLKGQILNQIPQARLIDVSHRVSAFSPQEAIYIIENSLKAFPKGSIHLIGIDSEISVRQVPILIVSNDRYYLGNDHGIIPTALANSEMTCYRLPYENPDHFLQPHIQAAKQLIQGKMPSEIGRQTSEFNTILLSKPLIRHQEHGGKVSLIVPKVIYTDHYGNAIFNLKKEDFETWQDGRPFKIKIGHYEINQLVNFYSDALQSDKNITADGHIFARFNQFGYFEIFMYKSNQVSGGANTLLGLQKNKTVHIIFES